MHGACGPRWRGRGLACPAVRIVDGKPLAKSPKRGETYGSVKVVAGGIEQVRGHEALGEDGVDAHVGVERVTGLGQVEFGCEQYGGGG